MATYKPPQSPGVSRSLLGACVIACCALLPPCATAAPDPSEGAGHTEQLDHAQTWRLDGWRAFQKSFEMDGQNQVLLQVAPESEAPGFRIAVTTAHMEALTLLADHMAERALLDSYIKRLFFKLGATPERVTTWECSLQAGRTTSPSDPTTPFGLQGEAFISPDQRGWWRACMDWDRTSGTLLVALAWQEGADQPQPHPLALFHTLLLHTKLTPPPSSP